MNETPTADPSTGPVVCARCETTSTSVYQRLPWCPRCEIWLFADPATRQWVSFAELRHRIRAADDAHACAASAYAVGHALPRLTVLVPEGWQISAGQNRPGALHTITVAPPPGSAVEVTANLWPPDRQRGWYVRVHNRTRRVDYPLYEGGGVRAAHYPTAEHALAAAVNAVRIDLAEPQHHT